MRALFAAPALALALSLAAAPAALAVDPEERLQDPALEQKARDISQNLRCVVCDNVSIDESNAQVAKDMRKLVRQRVAEGKTQAEIEAEFLDYYGDYVLLQPRFTASNILIWGAAPLALIIGFIWVRRRLRTPETEAEAEDAPEPAAPTAPPLSEEEKRRLEALLKES